MTFCSSVLLEVRLLRVKWYNVVKRKKVGKVKVKVTQSCLTLYNPVNYTVHGILQASILEWVAFPFSRGSSQPRDWTQVSCIAGGFFTSWATRAISQQFLTLILLLSLSSTFNDSCDYVVPISIFKIMYLLISNFISICRWNSPYHLMQLNHRIWGWGERSR